MFCPYCGKEINEEVDFCTKCNTNLKSIHDTSEYSCDKCGASAPADAKFCSNCGEKFEEEMSKSLEKLTNNSQEMDSKHNTTSVLITILGILFLGLYFSMFFTSNFDVGGSILLICGIGLLLRYNGARIFSILVMFVFSCSIILSSIYPQIDEWYLNGLLLFAEIIIPILIIFFLLKKNTQNLFFYKEEIKNKPLYKRRTRNIADLIIITLIMILIEILITRHSENLIPNELIDFKFSIPLIFVMVIIVIAAFLLKKGSKIGWWFFTIMFGVTPIGIIISYITDKADSNNSDSFSLWYLLFMCIFCIIPFIILLTDRNPQVPNSIKPKNNNSISA